MAFLKDELGRLVEKSEQTIGSPIFICDLKKEIEALKERIEETQARLVHAEELGCSKCPMCLMNS